MGQAHGKAPDFTVNQNEVHNKALNGADVTYHEGDFLKRTSREIFYDLPATPFKEDLPVPGAFLVHSLLLPGECLQYIEMSEEMGYSSAPLRNLDTVNSRSFALSQDTLNIRNSQRVLFDAPPSIASVLNARLLPHLPSVVECEGATWSVCQQGANKVYQRQVAVQ